MIGERVALLAGLFLAPAILLWLGHRMQSRSLAQRRAFWGGLCGFVLSLLVSLGAALYPPVWWAGGPFWRDFAVHWSVTIGTAVGLAVGGWIGARRSP